MADGHYNQIEQLIKAGNLGRQVCKNGNSNPYLQKDLSDQWHKSFAQATKDAAQQSLKDTATQEFYAKADGSYPSGSKTIFSRGGHDIRITNVVVDA